MPVPEYYQDFPYTEISVNPQGRLFCVSDIHGHHDLFRDMMSFLALQENDLLVINGDLTARGPVNLPLLHDVMTLCDTGRVILTMGNTDVNNTWNVFRDDRETAALILHNCTDYEGSLFKDMFMALDLPFSDVDDIMTARPIIRKEFESELCFLMTRPVLLETPDWRIVHGGIKTEDKEKLKAVSGFECLKYDRYVEYAPILSKPTVVGHTPVNIYLSGAVSLTPFMCTEKNVLSIDGGCGLRADRQLNLVELLPDSSWRWTSFDGFPSAIALDPQIGKEPSVRFMWPDSYADIISTGKVSSIVKQKTTGRCIQVPNRYISHQPKKISINDISDARAEIRENDIISIIDVLPEAAYIRKNFKAGWYYGRYSITENRSPEWHEGIYKSEAELRWLSGR